MTDSFEPHYGIAVQVEKGVRRLVARNPSPMTQYGTNTYLVGSRDIAVIDPGPMDETHLQAILDALTSEQTISNIIVTHTHLDHSPLARPLADATGAEILAFGTAGAGRSEVMQKLADDGLTGGGEGIDTAFEPDRTLRDGELITGSDWVLEVLHTPGHLGNHICLGFEGACFTADHVMGWASSLVSPPDGDLTDFMTSCARLQTRTWRRFYPGHGAVIDTPANRLSWLIEHRKQRETEILSVLKKGPADVETITKQVYTDTPRRLIPAAQRNVFAHLIDLYGKYVVFPSGNLTAQAAFEYRSAADQ